jgi:GNAT superfamily N-acetyltransferase
MLELRSIQPSEFQEFCSFFYPRYAETLLTVKISDNYDEAYSVIESDFRYLFPEGKQTPDQHIYNVYEGTTKVGLLWIGDRAYHRTPFTQAWIYYIEVVPEHRNKGIGTEILKWAEQYCIENQIPRLGLNVFAYNPKAKKLYERLGFEVYASCPHPNDPEYIYRYEMSKVPQRY